ncbi:TonB-dependent receptor [Persicobacter diffluens]|uniref:SusC/RagA family TonB-linked outer membrane protein n=1 Tax=Persicobacter diffluens TaxID=981 RepID=A0AAN4W427_9BACT|nr:SusC/RagA family TonB-linked outer membrane protein [Persicobacter diffluens]
MKYFYSHLQERGILVFALLMFCTSFAWAQNIKVRGTVSEKDAGSLPGVTVINEKTKKGTITDVEGQYQLPASVGDLLTFSFVGMKTVSHTVVGEELSITMTSDLVDLEEVVVIGYGEVKKKELTGAVAQIKADDITKFTSADLGTALQGQIAGVNISAGSGAPGAESNIQIRGISSISGSNTPLFVVDGIPQEGDPRLAANEIETIDVLKDAASCAIYGTRGAAGVILITTKQGKEGEMKISFDGSSGFQRIQEQSRVPLMNKYEQSYYDLVYSRNFHGKVDDEANTHYNRSQYLFLNDTDMVSYVLNDMAAVHNYNINAAGGTKKMKYNVSAGYFGQEGVVINSRFDRFNTRFNTEFQKGKLNIKTGLAFMHENQAQPRADILIQSTRYFPYQPAVSVDDGSFDTSGDGTNPLVLALANTMRAIGFEDTGKRNRINANMRAAYRITDNLRFESRVGANFVNYQRKMFAPNYAIYDRSGLLLTQISDSYIQQSFTYNGSISADASLNYTKKFDKHRIVATGAASYEMYSMNQFTAGRQFIVDNDIKVIEGGLLNPYAYSGGNDRTDILLGTLARVQYDYDSKYMLSASVRRDGSSRFTEAYRWGFFPSISAGWNVSDEPFWDNIAKTVNNFKLRASYGTTGNQNFRSYSFAPTITRNQDYIFGAEGRESIAYGAIQTAFANENVRWETTVQANFGIDIGMFDNRLTFGVDLYDTRKHDMLFPVQLPPSAGVGSGADSRITMNVGDMMNQGIEISAGYRSIDRAVKWGINGTFTKNINRVTRMSGEDIIYNNQTFMAGDPNSMVTTVALGHEVGAFFLYQTEGVIKTQEQLDAYRALVPSAKMGDLMYIDTNEDGRITEEDRVYSGSGLPLFEAGLNTNIEYKGFDFSMQWYANVGNKVMNGTKAAAYSFQRHKDLYYSWSEANNQSDVPAFRGDSRQHANYAAATDYWLEDGSFLRLRSVTLGYNFKKEVNDKLKVQGLRVYVTAQNPLTFTKYTGFDPDVGGNGTSTRGLDIGRYPIASQYLLGLKFSF